MNGSAHTVDIFYHLLSVECTLRRNLWLKVNESVFQFQGKRGRPGKPKESASEESAEDAE